MLLSKCSVCNSKKSKFLKEQETKGLLSNLCRGITPFFLIDSPITNAVLQKYKMNAVVNKLLLAGDKLMPEMHLRIVLLDNLQKTKKEYKNLKK